VGVEVIKTFAALLGILGLILLLAWSFRRFGLAKGGFDRGVPGWKLLGVKSLAPGKQIYIIEVGKKLLLVGSTDKMMTPLMEIDDAESAKLVSEAVAGNKTQLPSFKDFLRRAEK
jgi:flagellar biosynthetic protein FliO